MSDCLLCFSDFVGLSGEEGDEGPSCEFLGEFLGEVLESGLGPSLLFASILAMKVFFISFCIFFPFSSSDFLFEVIVSFRESQNWISLLVRVCLRSEGSKAASPSENSSSSFITPSSP